MIRFLLAADFLMNPAAFLFEWTGLVSSFAAEQSFKAAI